MLKETLANALYDPTVDLALEQERVDNDVLSFGSRNADRSRNPTKWPVDMVGVLNLPFTARSGTTRALARTMAKSFSARFRH